MREFLTMLRSALFASVAVLAGAMAFTAPAQSKALTQKECSVKFNDAKTAGTLGTMTWNEFRKAQCSDAAADTTTTPATTPVAAPAPVPAPAPAPTMAVKPAPAPVATGAAVFPTAVSPKYASETAGKQRMHTCLDQYNANKATNGNGGLKWIEKGGGYYSQCNAKLKG